MQLGLKLIVLSLLAINVFQLVWARLKVFEVNSKTTKTVGFIYDLLVAAHILLTVISISSVRLEVNASFLLGIFLYSSSFFLFRSCNKQVSRIAFAQEDNVSEIITTGGFRDDRWPWADRHEGNTGSFSCASNILGAI